MAKHKTMPTVKRIKAALRALNLDLFSSDPMVRPAPATLFTKIREYVRRRPAPDSISLTVDPKASAGDPQLREMFDRFNWMYFDGVLPPVRIIWSTRMMSAGSYTPHDRTIRIGRKYHELFPHELADTLKHEMIHIKHFHHDAAFKAEARRIGASLKAQAHPLLRKPARYIYDCPSCSAEYPRQRRFRMASCGRCSKGKFDARHKLRLKKA
jgi:predicted SprT family Zn-dependent metalloprotease